MGAGQADKAAPADRVQCAHDFRLLATHNVGDALRIDRRDTGHQPQLGACEGDSRHGTREFGRTGGQRR
jgi:hypothetical protein